jgi:hypothetical protein
LRKIFGRLRPTYGDQATKYEIRNAFYACLLGSRCFLLDTCDVYIGRKAIADLICIKPAFTRGTGNISRWVRSAPSAEMGSSAFI